jgi:hypothetical protein
MCEVNRFHLVLFNVYWNHAQAKPDDESSSAELLSNVLNGNRVVWPKFYHDLPHNQKLTLNGEIKPKQNSRITVERLKLGAALRKDRQEAVADKLNDVVSGSPRPIATYIVRHRDPKYAIKCGAVFVSRKANTETKEATRSSVRLKILLSIRKSL